MGRQCTVCNHAQLDAINEALIEGRSYNDIITVYNGITEMALSRHMNNHLPATLVKAHDAMEAAKADTLLAQVQRLQDKAMELLSKAEISGDLRGALQGVREAKGCLELLAKLQGQLQAETKVIIETQEVQALINQLVIIIQQEVRDPHTLQAIVAKLQEVDI